jgi:hypothetical protein
MPQNFLGCDRDQELLLPPSLKEWLPEEHLAWFVLEAVGELDLDAFYAAYRQDGWGRAAHDPAMMVALFVYAYAIGVRTSRGIERHCFDDVAFSLKSRVLSRCSLLGSASWSGGSVVAQFSFGAWLRTPCRSELSRLLNSLWAVSRPERNWSSPGQELPRRAGAKG